MQQPNEYTNEGSDIDVSEQLKNNIAWVSFSSNSKIS